MFVNVLVYLVNVKLEKTLNVNVKSNCFRKKFQTLLNYKIA